MDSDYPIHERLIDVWWSGMNFFVDEMVDLGYGIDVQNNRFVKCIQPCFASFINQARRCFQEDHLAWVGRLPWWDFKAATHVDHNSRTASNVDQAIDA